MALVMVLVGVAIFARLTDLQVLSSSRWVAYGVSQRDAVRTVPAARGTIYDRDGQAMAMSVMQPTIWADPTQIDHPGAVATKLAPVLGLEPAAVQQKLQGNGHTQYRLLARTVSTDVGKKVRDLREPGVYATDSFTRVKLGGDLARSVVGSTDADGKGISGFELAHNGELRGVDGSVRYERAHDGRTIAGGEQETTPAKPGGDLWLTLDQSLQYEAEQALIAEVGTSGAQGAMAIVSRPSTGEVLAMANVGRSADGTIAPTATNSALVSVFEPGSVNKIITVSAAIQEGRAVPSTVLSVPDHFRLGDHTFSDHDPHPIEQWTVADILAQSSNIGTILLAQQLGKEKMASYLQRFGLGTKTDLGFPGESGGLIRPVSTWYPTDMGSIPIGQGVAVTAMQMLSAFNVIANDGVYVAPKLVTAETNGGQKVVTPASPRHRVISSTTASAMQTMMAQVVNDGTGKKAAVPGYQAAGKTGTARIPQTKHTPGNSYMDASGHYHYMASFGGFIPGADLSILVVVQEPQTSVYASDIAAPVFSQLASWTLRKYQIPPPALLQAADKSVPALSSSVDEKSDNDLPVAGATPSTSTTSSTPSSGSSGASAGDGTGG